MLFNRKAFALIASSALLLSPILSHAASALSTGSHRPEAIARNMGEMTPEKMEEHLQKMAKELNLTPDQVNQIRTLRSTTHSKMDAVLSADQKAVIKATLKEGKGHKAAMKAANVTDAQRAQMKQIREDSKAAMDKILTPDQRAKLQEKMQQHQGKRHNQNRPN